ncbi:hypothetical protein AMTRI_Chr01g104910 [Amborella trichopoda]|uniref:Uncharacterized protein n=1 Tax=Amborella trichopoda TaxID=13333 RepID=U5DDG3_AMBTC|nr:hypothetical protein AMTR_s00190p00037690 [Amborella trichopoda]
MRDIPATIESIPANEAWTLGMMGGEARDRDSKDQVLVERRARVGVLSSSKGRMVRYFSLGSMVVLLGLTASLVVLPLVLPPLPPPPFMLLLLPVGILMVLLFFALSSSDITNIIVSSV